MEKVINSPSRSFLFYCGFFVLGVFCFSWVESRGSWLLILYVFVLILLFNIIFFWHKQNYRLLFFVLLFFILGALRMVWAIAPNDARQITAQVGAKKEVIGWVAGYPSSNQNSTRYYFQPEQYKGKILIYAGLYPKYNYGDRLKIKCVLSLPENKGDRFRYDKYLARYGALVTCYNPKVGVLPGRGGNFWQIQIAHWRQFLQKQIEIIWPSPESALMAGVLYGDSSALPQEVKDSFSRAGITHIVAVSGYNTSVIVIAVMAILIFVGLYRRQAYWLTNAQLILFVIFTGASASVVRAAIMAAVVLSAERFGRVGQSINILVLTAAMMVLINPYVLIWDAGFQLSFLSTVGIVYFNPIISKKFSRLPGWLSETLSSTLSAIIMTAPLLMYQFGRLSIVAPLANILVLWIIPVLMFLGMVVLVISIFSSVLASIFAWISYLGLHYVILIAKTLGNWPSASLEFTLPGWAIIGIYVGLVYFLIKSK